MKPGEEIEEVVMGGAWSVTKKTGCIETKKGPEIRVEVYLNYQGEMVHTMRGLNHVETLTEWAERWNKTGYTPGPQWGAKCRADFKPGGRDKVNRDFFKKAKRGGGK